VKKNIGHVARIKEKRGACKILIRKPEGTILFRKNRSVIYDNIKINFKEMGWKVVDWISLIPAREQWRASVKRLTSPGFDKVLETS
jgi:hypothetical protein